MTEKESCSTASSSSPAEDTIDIRLNDNDDDDNKTSNVDSNQILKVCRGLLSQQKDSTTGTITITR